MGVNGRGKGKGQGKGKGKGKGARGSARGRRSNHHLSFFSFPWTTAGNTLIALRWIPKPITQTQPAGLARWRDDASPSAWSGPTKPSFCQKNPTVLHSRSSLTRKTQTRRNGVVGVARQGGCEPACERRVVRSSFCHSPRRVDVIGKHSSGDGDDTSRLAHERAQARRSGQGLLDGGDECEGAWLSLWRDTATTRSVAQVGVLGTTVVFDDAALGWNSYRWVECAAGHEHSHVGSQGGSQEDGGGKVE